MIYDDFFIRACPTDNIDFSLSAVITECATLNFPKIIWLKSAGYDYILLHEQEE